MYLTYKKKKKYYKSLQFEDEGTHRDSGAKETFVEEARGEPEAVLNFFLSLTFHPLFLYTNNIFIRSHHLASTLHHTDK